MYKTYFFHFCIQFNDGHIIEVYFASIHWRFQNFCVRKQMTKLSMFSMLYWPFHSFYYAINEFQIFTRITAHNSFLRFLCVWHSVLNWVKKFQWNQCKHLCESRKSLFVAVFLGVRFSHNQIHDCNHWQVKFFCSIRMLSSFSFFFLLAYRFI